MIINMKYFNTYYFCSIAQNLVYTDDIDFAPLLSEFDTMVLEIEPDNFPKSSVLHQFCFWVVERYSFEGIEKFEKMIESEIEDEEEIENVLKLRHPIFFHKGFLDSDNYNYSIIELAIMHYFKGRCERLRDWIIDNKSEIQLGEISSSYTEYLIDQNLYYEVIENIVNEMVYILFQNRDFLLNLNEWLADLNPYETKRVTIPVWVQNAVFYRDNGHCVICKENLNGLVSPLKVRSKHFDHIVPIEKGGLNDISNIQLLCQECNLKKGTEICTDTSYFFYYDE